MYCLSDEPLRDRTPIAYCPDIGYYIYITHISYRDDKKIHNEKLFDDIDTLLEVLSRLFEERRVDKCQLIN